MKRCPSCNQLFDDENIFCLNDGSALEASLTSLPENVPTQVLPSFPTKIVPQKNERKGLYWVLGAMLLVIVALALVIYSLASRSETASSQNKNETTEKTKDTAETNIGNQSRISTEDKKTPQQSIPPLTTEAVRNLIDRWEKSQNMRNYNAYKACYAPQFFGVKRTKSGSETRMNYAQWLNDRQKMLKNTIDVGIQNLEITTDADTATARFIQQFQSVNYRDEGQKILKIKMFDDGAKIIYEELKYAY